LRSKLEQLEKLEKELSLKELQIKSLLTITQAINDNVPENGLFNMYRSFLSWEMGITKMCLFIRTNESWKIATQINLEEGYEEELITECLKHKRLHTIKEEDTAFLRMFDIIIPVFHKENPIAFALIGGIKDKEDIYNKIQFITTITNIIAVAIENKRLFKKQIKQERFKKELELAKEFQEMLIPEKMPVSDKFQLNTYYKPHDNIGGDYVDYIKFSDNRFAVVIADISGKGIAAALLMSNFQAMLHSLIHQYRDLETFVFALNQSVYRITQSDKFITFFIAEINLDNKELKYINAGHYPPILLSGGDVSLLKTGSSVIGAFEKLPSIQEETIKIKTDTLLFCFTDGLIDLKNEAGEYYDDDRLINFVTDNASLETEEFNQKLITDLEEFKGSQEYVDDIALLTAKIN